MIRHRVGRSIMSVLLIVVVACRGAAGPRSGDSCTNQPVGGDWLVLTGGVFTVSGELQLHVGEEDTLSGTAYKILGWEEDTFSNCHPVLSTNGTVVSFTGASSGDPGVAGVLLSGSNIEVTGVSTGVTVGHLRWATGTDDLTIDVEP